MHQTVHFASRGVATCWALGAQ